MWRQSKLDEKPEHTWQDAVVKWLTSYLRHKKLSEIDRNLLDSLAKKKEEEKVAAATVNRMLEIARAILNKAANDWGWIEKAPKIPMRYEGKHGNLGLLRKKLINF